MLSIFYLKKKNKTNDTMPAVANYASLVGLISSDCRVTEILDHGFFFKKKKLHFQSLFYKKKKNLETP
jgi:hypothetical protein